MRKTAITGLQHKTLTRTVTDNDLLNQFISTQNQLLRENAVIIASNYWHFFAMHSAHGWIVVILFLSVRSYAYIHIRSC